MYKKGELTTQQIVILIILIASFAVILFFLLRLNLGHQTSQQICHNSVITRGSSVVSADAFPLKCQRQYVCLSADGTCEKMTKPDVIKVKTKDDVYKALADQMAECWWMFGEGKVNYVGSDTIPKLYCSICAQIAFDDSVNKDIFGNRGSFDKKKFFDYMNNHKYSTNENYLQYLNLQKNYNHFSGNYGAVDLSKQQYSLVGITSDVSTWGWVWKVGSAVAIVAGGLALTPLTSGASGFGAAALIGGAQAAAAGGVVGGVSGGILAAFVSEGQSGEQYIPPQLIEVNSKQFNDLQCKSITTSS